MPYFLLWTTRIPGCNNWRPKSLAHKAVCLDDASTSSASSPRQPNFIHLLPLDNSTPTPLPLFRAVISIVDSLTCSFRESPTVFVLPGLERLHHGTSLRLPSRVSSTAPLRIPSPTFHQLPVVCCAPALPRYSIEYTSRDFQVSRLGLAVFWKAFRTLSFVSPCRHLFPAVESPHFFQQSTLGSLQQSSPPSQSLSDANSQQLILGVPGFLSIH